MASRDSSMAPSSDSSASRLCGGTRPPTGWRRRTGASSRACAMVLLPSPTEPGGNEGRNPGNSRWTTADSRWTTVWTTGVDRDGRPGDNRRRPVRAVTSHPAHASQTGCDSRPAPDGAGLRQALGDDLDGELGLDVGVERTGTTWVPTDLIGSARWILRRSSTAPVWASTASAMSAVVTEPNRRPSAPARAVMVTVAALQHAGHGLRRLLVLGVAQVAGLAHRRGLGLDAAGGDEGAARSGRGSCGRSPWPPRRCRPSSPRRRCHFAAGPS